MTTRDEIYLAALLHDIGKFWQRADESDLHKSKLNKEIRNLIDFICPSDSRGKFGYLHVLWSAQFFNDFVPNVFKKGINNYTEKNKDNLVNNAIYHHYPDTILQSIVSLADSISAGTDRLENIHEDSEISKFQKLYFKNTPLVTPFYLINTKNFKDNGSEKGDEFFCFKLDALNINDPFPFKYENGLILNYNKHWEKFSEEITNYISKVYNNENSFYAYAETMFYLLKKYTWCIPSDTNEYIPVTSLFDHLKTTAAFALTLYDCYTENNETLEFNDTKKGKKCKINEGCLPFLAVGGDISGIQKYIYNIHRNKAANSLKGRSFFVQLLSECIIDKIIHHQSIKSYSSNVIYSAGGKFYLLLPNLEKVKNALREIQEDIDDYLWKNHAGKIAFLYSHIDFSIDPLNYKMFITADNRKLEIGKLWSELAKNLEVKKNKKFESYLIKNSNIIFSPSGEGGSKEVCSVNGEEIEQKELKYLDQEMTIPVSQGVYLQYELGSVLKDADYTITYINENENTYLNSRSKFHIKIAGNINNYLFDQNELTKEDADFRKIFSADDCLISRINDTNFLVTLKGNRAYYGFKFYGGNKQSQVIINNKTRDKTFEELSYLDFVKEFPIESDKLNPEKHSYLGILRMDVDHLGKIFSVGIERHLATFSMYSSVSFLLDLFFSGHINSIRNNNEFSNHLNILYSGGDDLFVIGRWDKVIGFALQVNENFEKFTGRKDITLSGGIVITSPKFPISKAALIAGEFEEKAKDTSRNAITIFNIVLTWNELKEAEVIKNKIVKFIEEEKLSKAIIQKILSFYNMKIKNTGSYSYIWNATYTIARYIERFKDSNGKIKSGYEEVMYFLGGKPGDTEANHNSLLIKLWNPAEYEKLAVSARWAELELRDKEKYKKSSI